MFSIKQTRLFVVLAILAAILFSFAGLNWRAGDKEKPTMHARLEIPVVDPGRVSTPQPVVEKKAAAPVVELDVVLIEEEPVKAADEDFAGALKDTGIEIILD